MSRKLILVVNNQHAYYSPFAQFGEYHDDIGILETDPQQVALVVFTGGADVTPSYYGEERHKKTFNNEQRDAFEKKVFDRARGLGLPIVGICRGSQFVCAMSGGKVVQHITNHAGRWHNIKTDEGESLFVSSTHHQMQLPPKEAVPIAWAEPKLSTCYEGPEGVQYEPEYEYDVVWYPHTNALGIQYHPEMMREDSKGFLYPASLMKRFFDLPIRQSRN
jgi:putative glutamine amidotransferase